MLRCNNGTISISVMVNLLLHIPQNLAIPLPLQRASSPQSSTKVHNTDSALMDLLKNDCSNWKQRIVDSIITKNGQKDWVNKEIWKSVSKRPEKGYIVEYTEWYLSGYVQIMTNSLLWIDNIHHAKYCGQRTGVEFHIYVPCACAWGQKNIFTSVVGSLVLCYRTYENFDVSQAAFLPTSMQDCSRSPPR